MAYVTRPSIVFPSHEITTEDVVADIRQSLTERADRGDVESAGLLRRLDGLAQSIHVERRRFVAPLEEVAQARTVQERNRLACAGMLKLAVKAAQHALHEAGLTPGEIDVLITSHSTTPMTPGLDVHLVNELGLRPDVWRQPATQLGCVGGAHTLAWAAQLAKAFPSKIILVVDAEALSSVHQRTSSQHRENGSGLDNIIFRMLFGDSAGACIVSAKPLGPGLKVEDSWQYVVPNTMDYYTLFVETDGLHFTSRREAPGGISQLMDPLWTWLRKTDPDWVPDVVIAHPGGPKVLNLAAKGLGCPPGLLSHSWDSLRDYGNLGGVAVLHILAKTYEDAPRNGSRTLLFGAGPGFTGAALAGEWTA
ncbi:PhlD [Streptomyces abikoensis]|uniref:type III polyketide synthase n=1 Tax=Streptomyces abikoensis TaxID=97398 RepID=UPI0033DEDA3D